MYCSIAGDGGLSGKEYGGGSPSAAPGRWRAFIIVGGSNIQEAISVTITSTHKATGSTDLCSGFAPDASNQQRGIRRV